MYALFVVLWQENITHAIGAFFNINIEQLFDFFGKKFTYQKHTVFTIQITKKKTAALALLPI
jgi:hypothetical protein